MESTISLNNKVRLNAIRFMTSSNYERIWRIRITWTGTTQIPWLIPVTPPNYIPEIFYRDLFTGAQEDLNEETKILTLLASNPRDCAWVYVAPYIYLRVRELDEPIESAFGSMVAYENSMYFNNPIFLSNERYKLQEYAATNVTGWQQIRPFMISEFTTKMTADTTGVLKFNTISVELIRTANLSNGCEEFIGNPLTIYDNELEIIDRMVVRDGSDSYEKLTLNGKDYRSSISDMLPVLQWDKTRFVQSDRQNVIAMSDKTSKQYIQEAIGYCRGVPGICLNDYSYDHASIELYVTNSSVMTAHYRYFYFCGGDFIVDKSNASIDMGSGTTAIWRETGVEVKGDDGWFWLPEYNNGSTTGTVAQKNWELVQREVCINPDLELYKVVTLLVVKSLVTNPPKSGTTTPNYGGTGREIRVTGLFHSEIEHIERPWEIIKYIFQNYSSQPWNESYFSIASMEQKLSILNDDKVGIFCQKPKEIFKQLQLIQNGCTIPFQFIINKGKIDILVNDPNADFLYEVMSYEILNIGELTCSMNGTDYVSNLILKYSKVQKSDEEEVKTYTNDNVGRLIVSDLGLPVTKTIETLLAIESDAEKRYINEMKCLLGICPSIEGISLCNFDKYKHLRPYDKIIMKIPELTSREEWMITAVNINWTKETVNITVRSLPILDINQLINESIQETIIEEWQG